MPTSFYDMGIDKLSPQDRLRLIGEIWDSLEPADQVQLPETHWREIEDRIAHADATPGEGSTLEEVMARLLDKR